MFRKLSILPKVLQLVPGKLGFQTQLYIFPKAMATVIDTILLQLSDTLLLYLLIAHSILNIFFKNFSPCSMYIFFQ